MTRRTYGVRKLSKDELARRIAVVQQLLLEGKPTPVIVQSIAKQWGISTRMAYNYVDKAWEDFASKYMKERDRLLGFHVAARLNLFRKAYDNGHYGVCRSILEDLAKLQGLYVNKIAFTDPEGEIDYGALTVDELVKRLLAILEVKPAETFNSE